MPFDLFSADDHVIEHGRVWTDRIAARFRDAAPQVVEEDGREFWTYEGTRSAQMGLNAVAGKSADEYTPDPIRFSDMIPAATTRVPAPVTCFPTGSGRACAARRCRASAARCSTPSRTRIWRPRACPRTTTSSLTSGARPCPVFTCP